MCACPVNEDQSKCNEKCVFVPRNEFLVPLCTKAEYPPPAQIASMKDVIRRLTEPPKGIFQFDDEPRAIGLKLASIDLVNTAKNRKKTYSAFIGALEPDFISGVVLSEEILEYSEDPEFGALKTLARNGILYGVRADRGVGPLSGAYRDECRTDGFCGLSERLRRHKAKGCELAKWRVVARAGEVWPSRLWAGVASGAVGRFAAVAVSRGLVPLIEVELIDYKSAHDMSLAAKVLEKVLAEVVKTLSDFHVPIEAAVLQVPMPQCAAGCQCGRVTAKGMAESALACLKAALPPATGGLAVITGGLSEEVASAAFAALAADPSAPWPLTFAFGRALTQSAIHCWDPERTRLAQEQLRRRIRADARARRGQYGPDPDAPPAADDELRIGEMVY